LRSKKDLLLHAFDILQNFIVPKPDNNPPTLHKPCCSAFIFLVLVMLTAIGLYNDLLLQAGKIGNERTNGALPPEF
jgi:hypothetical protein